MKRLLILCVFALCGFDFGDSNKVDFVNKSIDSNEKHADSRQNELGKEFGVVRFVKNNLDKISDSGVADIYNNGKLLAYRLKCEGSGKFYEVSMP